MWALTDRRSMPCRLGRITYFPYAWIASTWSSVFGFFSFTIREISSMGSTAPTSLFTYMTDTRIVSDLTAAFNSSRLIWPSRSTGRIVTSNPSSSRYSSGLYTDGCSTAVLMMCVPARRFASAAPINAILFDSDPPEVKRISFSSAFNVSAIIRLASRIYCSASMPLRCFDAGFA